MSINIKTVTLPLRDWQHVFNAIEASYQRKKRRKELRKADEMELIALAISRQVLQKEGAKS